MNEEELLKVLNKEKSYTEEDLLLFIYDLRKENARLKDKIEKAKKLIEVDTYAENIYLGFCYLFGNYEYEDLPKKIKDVLENKK